MSTKTLRWGIIATGAISTNFANDLLTDPSARGASSVSHSITAVGARALSSAETFVSKLKSASSPSDWGVKQGHLDNVKAYGSYDEVFVDPNVDVVYIGTPHTYHHANTKSALLAGKHVLCEKPFTLSMEELDELLKIAEERKLFLMEAVWTRFHPIAYAVQDVIFSGKLGKVKRFQADFSMFFDIENLADSHRMIDPALGGGSLLDMGPYPSVWAMLLLFLHPSNARTPPNILFSHQTIYPRSQVDKNSRWLLEFPGLDGVQAMLTTDMDTQGCGDMTVLISCEKADLSLAWGPFKPQTYYIIPHTGGPHAQKSAERREVHVPVQGNGGMAYEADEVYRCIQAGKLQSERMPWDESRIVQGWFDKVRNEGGSCLRGLKGTVGQ